MKTNIENKYWIQVLIEIKLKSNLRLNSIFKRIWDKDIENRFEDNLIEIPFVLTFPPFLNLMSGKWGLIVCNWDVRQLKTIVINRYKWRENHLLSKLFVYLNSFLSNILNPIKQKLSENTWKISEKYFRFCL